MVTPPTRQPRRLVHLRAQPLGDDGDVDELKQLMGVGPEAPAVERGEDAGLAAQFCVMNCRVGLVAVDMQRAAALEVQHRERVDMLIVATAHDGALAVLWHDE
jgi:hypothetical protein